MNLKFELGETVYLKTDTEQLQRMVTEISLSGSSMNDHVVIYELSQSDLSSKHYSAEMSRNRNAHINLGL
jgi:hypothetical protein|tara:strand:- start:505 stop:714 length:210 start_codon:yes stop_codon:yes gene_type:complete